MEAILTRFPMTHGMQSCRQLTEKLIGWAEQSGPLIRYTRLPSDVLMGLLSPCPPCSVPTSHSGCQEIHVAGAGLAGLAFAIRIAENTPVYGRTLIFVWDGRLQRIGMPRKRRVVFRSHGRDDVAQAVSLHGSTLNAAVSSDTQAALFPEGKQHVWEDTGNMSISNVEEALLRRAQSPDLAQHIIFKDHDLSKDVLQAIASKPHVIIIGTDSGRSIICKSFAAAQIPQRHQEPTCNVELAYHMDEGLKSALKQSAATSVVHTVGQRVFLHNFDCKGGRGTVTIRATQAELDELAHYRQQTSSATLADFGIAVAMAKELHKQQSPAAVSLSDLIDTARQVYGIPATAVKRITGTRNTLSRAPFFARELHPNSVDGGHLMLIGDAAMRVEFWPGKGVNAAFATAHVAAVSLLSSMTKDANQPYFALSQRHLRAFSRQMADVADQFEASRSMDLLAVPPASSRWSVVAAMAAEDVVHELMEQICERGATAVEHLWPIIPSHMLVEERLRQLIPSKVHVLRRMLRDGPWPEEGAKVMAPLELPPLPSRRTLSSPAVLDTNLAVASPRIVTAPARRLQKAPHLNSSRHGSIDPAASPSRHDDTNLAQPVSRHDDISPATPLSCHDDISPATPLSHHEHAAPSPHSTSRATLHVNHSPTISSTAPARNSPSQQTDMQPLQAPNSLQHVSLDASSDQSSPASASGQSSLSQSTSPSAGSSGTVDSQTLSDIETKIAVLTKWGQPLPPSLNPPQSSSRHPRRPTTWPRLKKQDVVQAEQLSSSIRHADSARYQQPTIETPANVSNAEAQAVLRQQAAVGTEMPSHSVLKRTKSAHSTPQTPPQQSPKSKLNPPRVLLPYQGVTQQLQPASTSSGSPSSTQSSSSLAQSSPSLAQSSSTLPQSLPRLPQQATRQGPEESQGLREAGSYPKAQSPLQMWPHVRKYAVPQPLKAASTVAPNTAPPPPPRSPVGVSNTKRLQPSNKASQLQHQSLAQSSDRHSGMAESSSMASPDWSPSPVLSSATAAATLLGQTLTNLPADSQHQSDSGIQPQTPLPSSSHRRMYSQDACQQQQADVVLRPEVHTTAGNVVNHMPEWIAHEGSSPQRGTAGNAVGGNIWQTPQLPSTWSGQGNPLFGWWEMGSAIVGDEELHGHGAAH